MTDPSSHPSTWTGGADPAAERADRSWPEDPFPKVIDRYRILSVLGSGGQGTVYLAQDTTSGRRVALKVARRDLTPEQRTKFLETGRLIAGLTHRNLGSVLAVGEHAGWAYLVLGYIEGPSLSAVIQSGLPPLADAIRIVQAIAQALDHAHQRGVLHLDLKPSNILIDAEGQPMVMDFGLAAAWGPTAADDLSDAVVGTPAYMSPEQIRGDRSAIGPAADVYSLGVVLYQALTGQLPFAGPSSNVLYHAVYTPAPPPSSQRAGIDPQLDEICLRALAKRPEERYRTMAEFADALGHCPVDAPSSAAPAVPATPVPPSPPAEPLGIRLKILDRQQGAFLGHFTGTLELGRQQTPDEPLFSARKLHEHYWRIPIARHTETTVSRRQVLVEMLAADRVRISSLASASPLKLSGGQALAPAESAEVVLPTSLLLGSVTIELSAPGAAPAETTAKASEAATDNDNPAAVEQALQALVRDRLAAPATAAELSQFWKQVAHLIVERFRCEVGQVLLWEGGDWQIVVVSGSGVRGNPSLRMLRSMREQKQPVWTQHDDDPLAHASVLAIDSAMAIPLIDSQGVVVGAFYCQFSPFASPHLDRPLEIADIRLLAALALWAARAWERVTTPPPAAVDTRRSRAAAAPTVGDAAFSSDTVVVHFPAPIALPHRRFFQQREPKARLDRLFLAQEATLRYLVTIGLADLFACLAARGGPEEGLLDHPALEFLRRPANLTQGKWLDALRTTAAALANEPNRLLTEFPKVCAAGGELDADVFGPLIHERNQVAHSDGSLTVTEDESRDLVRLLRPKVEEAFRLIRFVRRYPLGFVTQFHATTPAGVHRYFVHSCMGARIATDDQASLVETTANLAEQVPFLVSPTGESLLYLWPLWAQRKADSTQQPSLYCFEQIAGKAGQFLTRIRRSAIDLRDPWEETLQPGPAASHDWLWQKLRELPAVQKIPAELGLPSKLQSSRDGRLVGQRLGSNELLTLVAAGGFGTIYEARNKEGKRVAVKVLESRETLRQYARFQREFQKLQELGDCSGIIRCYESGDCLVDERIVYWYSMDFADGGDLTGWIQTKVRELDGRLLWEEESLQSELIAQFQAIVAAVAHLHQSDLIHRDIKPSNVLVMDDGRLCLSDFGLAKSLDESAASLLTSTAASLGTPVYMPPEQERGGEVDRAADVYSLGILLGELLTGIRPEPNTKTRKGSTLRQWRPLKQLPTPLATLIQHCTDVLPTQRPADAQALAAEFLAAIGEPAN